MYYSQTIVKKWILHVIQYVSNVSELYVDFWIVCYYFGSISFNIIFSIIKIAPKIKQKLINNDMLTISIEEKNFKKSSIFFFYRHLNSCLFIFPLKLT